MSGEKRALRETYARLRASLDGAVRQEAHARMLRQVCAHPAFADLQTALLCYASLPDEPDTWALLRIAWQRGKRTALPRCEGAGQMRFFLADGMHALRPGSFGVMEPDASCPLYDPSAADLCIVPGLAFDRDGYRLGYGGGYYDRYLALHPMQTVGFCYPNALVLSLPREPLDIPVRQVFC